MQICTPSLFVCILALANACSIGDTCIALQRRARAIFTFACPFALPVEDSLRSIENRGLACDMVGQKIATYMHVKRGVWGKYTIFMHHLLSSCCLIGPTQTGLLSSLIFYDYRFADPKGAISMGGLNHLPRCSESGGCNKHFIGLVSLYIFSVFPSYFF